jgi:uncharacterized OB-fold protein
MAVPLPDPTDVERPYWEAGREGVLRMQRCPPCEKPFFPPANRCPACGSTDIHWVDLSGRGKIWSWVVFHRAFFPAVPIPYTTVRVQLDEGPFLITNLVEEDGREPTGGAPVHVVFQASGDLFLPQFALS